MESMEYQTGDQTLNGSSPNVSEPTNFWNDNYIDLNSSSQPDEDNNQDYFDIQTRASTWLVKPNILIIIILSFISLMANLATIIAILQVKHRWTSLFRFMLSLIMSDLLIAVSILAHVMNRIFNPLIYAGEGPYADRIISRCSYIVIKAFNTTALNISLLNLMGMAIDHYVAILSPLKYYTLLNKKRSSILICILWLAALITGFSDFASPLFNLPQYRKYIARNFNYCEYVSISKYHEEYITLAVAFICYIVMLNIYIKIYCSIRKKRRESVVINNHRGVTKSTSSNSNRLNVRKLSRESQSSNGSQPVAKPSNKFRSGKRNTRALVTTLLILGCFMVCWLPTCFFEVTTVVIKHINHTLPADFTSVLVSVSSYINILLLVNTLCDPLIYAIRIGDVRQGFSVAYRKVFRLKRKFSLSSVHGSVTEWSRHQRRWEESSMREPSDCGAAEVAPEESKLKESGDSEAIPVSEAITTQLSTLMPNDPGNERST